MNYNEVIAEVKLNVINNVECHWSHSVLFMLFFMFFDVCDVVVLLSLLAVGKMAPLLNRVLVSPYPAISQRSPDFRRTGERSVIILEVEQQFT